MKKIIKANLISWKIKEGVQLDHFDEPDEHAPLDSAQMVQAGISLKC